MLPSHSDHKLSRRSLMKAAALSAATLTLTKQVNAAKPGSGFVDAHVHIWTPDTKRYPIAKGFEKGEYKPASFTPEELFAECRPNGVDRVVLIQMSFYQYDNSYMLDAIKKYPEVFRGVGIIDETLPTAGDTMRDLLKSGVTGFRLYANRKSAESWLQSKEMNAMWTVGSQTRQAMSLLSDPDALPAIRSMIEKHPETPVVIDHFSRIGVKGTFDETELKNLCDLAKFPHVYVKTSAFYALGKKQPPYTDLGPMIRRLRDSFGANRLMWASDCPFQVQNGNSYKASVDLIRDKLDFLTEEDKNWILSKTAERVYWIS